MSARRAAAVMVALLGVACDGRGAREPVAPPAALTFGVVRGPDLAGTPDLIVDERTLATSWAVFEQQLRESLCSFFEEGIGPGVHRVLRFTVTTPNVGDADLYVGSPWSHVDPNGDGSMDDSDGLFEQSLCHGHFHFRNYARYELVPAGSAEPILARKRGFCMLDVTPWKGETAPGGFTYRSCGSSFEPGSGNQGISAGWADTYSKWLDGQFFLLDDPAEPVPPGEYVLRITVNPPFAPAEGEPCPAVDARGLCHMFAERDYDNNVAEVRVTLPQHVGKTGSGPGAGLDPPGELVDDEQRPAGT